MKIFKYAMICMLLFTISTSTSFADEVTAYVEDVGASIDQTFEAGDRAFPNQGGVGYAAMPGYFGDNNKPGHQFIPLAKMMMYTTTWNVEDAKKMIANHSTKINSNIAPLVDPVKTEEQSTNIICTRNAFDKEKFEVTQLAFGTVNATNKKGISAYALAEALIEASKLGATHIQFLGEGTNTELSSGGWGIGLAYTKASDTAVSTGGTGFSTGWAGYNNLPWQQFIILKVVDPNAISEVDVEDEKELVVESTTVVDEQVDKAVKSVQ